MAWSNKGFTYLHGPNGARTARLHVYINRERVIKTIIINVLENMGPNTGDWIGAWQKLAKHALLMLQTY